MKGEFSVDDFVPAEFFHEITRLRVSHPELFQEAQERLRITSFLPDQRLVILAADHPAHGITECGDDPTFFADRWEYLGRILRILLMGGIDGVMGTTDVVEDLFAASAIIRKRTGRGILDNIVLLGSMNRGGIRKSVFELDERMTSWTAESIARMGLDGAKLMISFDLSNPDTGKTIKYCADAINALVRLTIPVYLEVLPVKKEGDKLVTDNSPETLMRAISIGQALGESSMRMWLKLPYVEGYEKVARATTLPILILGGAPEGDIRPSLERFYKAMRAGENVRGVLAGRNILVPGKGDPYGAAAAVHALVHEGASVDEALSIMEKVSFKDMDYLKRIFS